MWWNGVGSLPDCSCKASLSPKAFHAELQPWWLRSSAWPGAPSLVQDKASTHARQQVGFKAIPAFSTPANTLSVPGKHPRPSSENFLQEKARPSAQLASSSIHHLWRLSYQPLQGLGDGPMPPSLLCSRFIILLLTQCKCHTSVLNAQWKED